MKVLNPIELFSEKILRREGTNGGDAMNGSGEVREYRGLGNTLQSLDAPGRCQVETTKNDKEDTKDECRQNHPRMYC